ncbi:MAG: hypothetical protein K5829_04285 [Treponema sp.]|nr:hypothetical protein [Treponema sp.]
MKKVKFLGLALIASVVFAGCNSSFEENTNDDDSASKLLAKILPEQFADIGNNHNEILNDFYFGSERSVLNNGTKYKELSVEDYFGVFDEVYYLKDFSILDSRTADVEDVSVTDSLLEKELISDIDANYISKIEKVLDAPLETLEETQNAIAEIEVQALNTVENSDLYEFFSYAETAKASLEFWTENIETLENSEDLSETSARWIIKDAWNKYKHKLGMMAASDAAGGAVGAGIGAAIASTIFGPESAGMGAIIGAAVVGSASSAEGFKQDKVCIVVSISDIEKKIRNH